MSRKAVRIIGVMAVVGAGLLVSTGVASAAVYSNGTSTTNFDVKAVVTAHATIAAAPLDFGNLGVLATPTNVNSTINITATNTTPYNVGISAGTGSGSTGTTRYMSGTGANTSTIAFNLFQAAGNTIWGDTQGTNTRSGVGTGATQSLTVYGTVPAQTTPQPDTYKSTLTVTVYF